MGGREVLLEMKMADLVLRVQREQLSFEEYTRVVGERVQRDRVLALYLHRNGRTPEAVRTNTLLCSPVHLRPPYSLTGLWVVGSFASSSASRSCRRWVTTFRLLLQQ
jgi:hypothetical protein